VVNAENHLPRTARSARRRAGIRRYYRNTIGSTIVPGLGLIPTRLRTLGWILTGGFVLSLLTLLILVLSSGALRTALSIGLSRNRLLVVFFAMLVAAAVWCASIVLTAWASRPPFYAAVDRLLMPAFAASCCALVVVPTVMISRVLTEQRSVVAVVFGNAGGSSSNPDTAKKDPWANVPRVNMLLLGSDAGVGREGTRTDSMLVASINTKTGDTVLFGIPRNLENVPFSTKNPLHALYPQGYNCGDQCLMNGVWTLAEDHKDLFPATDKSPGLTATKDAIGQVLGLSITDTTVVDLKGFQQLVDAMGGIDINVQHRVCVGCKAVNGQVVWSNGKPEYIEPGQQHLNGRLALWYARSRAETDDFDRMRRQRCVTGAILDQANPLRLLANYGELAKALKNNVSVSIPQEDLPAWADLVSRVQQGTIRSLPLTNKVINVGRPDYDKIHALVREAINPAPRTATPSPTTSRTPTPSKTATPSTSTSPTTDTLTDLAAAC
jgi:LCP family protein required for cell wall assembly